MSSKEIAETLAKQHAVEEIIMNITKQNVMTSSYRDLAQDIYLQILEDKNHKFSNLNKKNEILYYIIGIVRKNIFSKTSPYYSKYRDFSTRSTNIDDCRNI